MTEKDQTTPPFETQPLSRWQRVRRQLLQPRFLGLLAGALGGYLYYTEIGCKQGSCPITSNPWLTIVWGALLGYLIADMFRPKSKA